MDGRHAADMIVTTFHVWRNTDHVDDVWKAAHNLTDVHGCAEPALPIPRKIPGHLMMITDLPHITVFCH